MVPRATEIEDLLQRYGFDAVAETVRRRRLEEAQYAR
jgi:hypothetical protein